MVVFYYQTINTKTARENCEFKTITVCKGSCYVTKQIRLVSSDSNKESNSIPQIDLTNFKEVIAVVSDLETLPYHPSEGPTRLFNEWGNHYSYQHISNLIKPPIA